MAGNHRGVHYYCTYNSKELTDSFKLLLSLLSQSECFRYFRFGEIVGIKNNKFPFTRLGLGSEKQLQNKDTRKINSKYTTQQRSGWNDVLIKYPKFSF